jgi:hypothetical protein
MSPSSSTRFPPQARLLSASLRARAVSGTSLHVFPKCAIAIVICVLAGAGRSAAQSGNFSGPPGLDTLGAHGNRGRECVVCHPPHSERPALREGSGSWMDSNVPEGAADHAKYSVSPAIGESEHAVQVAPASVAAAGAETSGVLLCLSCHDGNLTPQNMLASRSYSERMGLQPGRSRMIPSLLDERGSEHADHPMGVEARIETGYGLVFSNGKFSVQPNTPYAYFVAAYGMPTLAPSMRSNPYGIDAQGRPYLVCTTCHNQHVMSVYVSRPDSPIANDHGYKSYTTFFFVNAPYDHHGGVNINGQASSRAQFCRQCHFRFSNEANNSYFIPTLLE